MRNFIDNIKELKKTKNGKPILFFGFYLLFFIFILLLITFKGDRNYYKQEYEKGRPNQFNSSMLLNKNFYYDYKINIDGVMHNYYGKMNKDIESFKYNNNDYYRNNDNFFVNNGTWVKTENPYVFYEIINVDNMSNIINNSTLMSKDANDSGKIVYKYLISTNTIDKIIYNIDTDYDEVPNELEIIMDKDNGSCTINLELNSFCLLNSKCSNNLSISTNYEMFNNVKEIKSPIE